MLLNDELIYLLQSIGHLAIDRMGRTGIRYISGIRVGYSERTGGSLVSFDGLGRPFRLYLKPIVTDDLGDLLLIEWRCLVTGDGCWWTCVDVPPRDRPGYTLCGTAGYIRSNPTLEVN